MLGGMLGDGLGDMLGDGLGLYGLYGLYGVYGEYGEYGESMDRMGQVHPSPAGYGATADVQKHHHTYQCHIPTPSTPTKSSVGAYPEYPSPCLVVVAT
jgi:hypothetical protein